MISLHRQDLEEVIRVFGRESQVAMAVEELAELIVAINHRERNRASVEALSGEIADVEIMLAQLKIIYDCHALVTNEVEKKLTRLWARTASEWKECGGDL